VNEEEEDEDDTFSRIITIQQKQIDEESKHLSTPRKDGSKSLQSHQRSYFDLNDMCSDSGQNDFEVDKILQDSKDSLTDLSF